MNSITVLTGNLFEIAATELGSALQWINIARANELSDAFIYSQQEILIPRFSAAFEDGIGPQ